jgi:uncharacterized membrane protein YeaQ/YmgE (transglycosylase-associated protein family)
MTSNPPANLRRVSFMTRPRNIRSSRWNLDPNPDLPRYIHGPRNFKMNLSGESLLVILIVGVVAGWLAGQIVRGAGFGLIGDLVVGVIGAFLASLLFPRLGFHLGTGVVSEILYSAIGAIVLLLILRLVSGRGRFA